MTQDENWKRKFLFQLDCYAWLGSQYGHCAQSYFKFVIALDTTRLPCYCIRQWTVVAGGLSTAMQTWCQGDTALLVFPSYSSTLSFHPYANLSICVSFTALLEYNFIEFDTFCLPWFLFSDFLQSYFLLTEKENWNKNVNSFQRIGFQFLYRKFWLT